VELLSLHLQLWKQLRYHCDGTLLIVPEFPTVPKLLCSYSMIPLMELIATCLLTVALSLPALDLSIVMSPPMLLLTCVSIIPATNAGILEFTDSPLGTFLFNPFNVANLLPSVNTT